MKSLALFFTFLLPFSLLAQYEFGLSVNGSTYGGDLAKTPVIAEETNLGGTLFGRYFLSEQLSVGLNLSYGKISGKDANKQSSYVRNLDFESNIQEAAVVVNYDLFDIDINKFTPYVFAGMAVFKHNPTTEINGQKVELQPLGTEGQGNAGYGDYYKLTQFAIPYGAGVKYRISDQFIIQADLGARMTFTDHLDDVGSNTYAPYDVVLNNGELAVQAAYKADQVPGTVWPAYSNFQGENAQEYIDRYPRAISENNDWYYFGGVGAVYRISDIRGDKIRKNRKRVPNKYKGKW